MHPRLHRRNPQINFLIVTNHRYVLKDSDLFFSQHFKKIVGRFNGRRVLVRFIISDIKPESCKFE
jgi:hypothetical protein